MAVPAGEFALERIFIRDASFESPHGPAALGEPWQPQIQLEISTRATPLGDERFEVVLTVTAHAKQGQDKTVMIVEVQQAGVFRVRGFPEDRLRRILATHCPGILFPYARESIDSLVVKGGFPPLMLAPVNFDAMFDEALKQRGGTAPVQH